MKKIIFIICLMMSISGCTAPAMQRIPFPIEEYQKLPKMGTGTATITGQVFLRTTIGEVRYGAGSEVHLYPVTSYTTQGFELRGNWSYGNWTQPWPRFEPDTPDPRADEYEASTQADGEGWFEFKNVPAGNYYAWSSVVWYVPGSYGRMQGGSITKRIHVEDDQELKVILTR